MIRSLLVSVPWQHPLWKIDTTARDNAWSGSANVDVNDVVTIVPTSCYNISLIPVDVWVRNMPLDLQCD